MKKKDPLGFTFLQIAASVILVGAAGISLINYLIANLAYHSVSHHKPSFYA